VLGKKLDQLADRGTVLWITVVTATIAALIFVFDQSEFEKYRQSERSLAERFKYARGEILNLAYLRGPIIGLVYPFEENRALVGRDLRDTDGQYAVVQRIHETGTPELHGPVKLLQGTLGIIVRIPVQPLETDQGGVNAPGTVSVVLDASRVLDQAIAATVDAEPLSRDYRVALRSADGVAPMAILGDATAFGADPIRKTLLVPGVRLQLAVAPKDQWGAGYEISWARTLGLFAIGLIAVLIIAILRQQRRDRRAAQAQLANAVDSLADGFVLFDDDDRLVLSNRRYVEIHDKCAEAIRPGAKFEDILRLGIKRGQFPEAEGREEEWLAKQLKKPGKTGRDFEVGFSDGRWLRIIEKPTPTGGRVGLRIDITKQVENCRSSFSL